MYAKINLSSILLISILFCKGFSVSTINAQHIKGVNKYGTIIDVKNNQVFTKTTDPTPTDGIEGDIWKNTTTKMFKIKHKTGWESFIGIPSVSAKVAEDNYSKNGQMVYIHTLTPAASTTSPIKTKGFWFYDNDRWYSFITRTPEPRITRFSIGGEVGKIDSNKREITISIPYNDFITSSSSLTATVYGYFDSTTTQRRVTTTVPMGSLSLRYGSFNIKDINAVYSSTAMPTYRVKIKVKTDNSNNSNSDIYHIVKKEIARLGNTANLNHLDVSQVTNMFGLFCRF